MDGEATDVAGRVCACGDGVIALLFIYGTLYFFGSFAAVSAVEFAFEDRNYILGR